jgi:hypothetical protein
MVIYRERMTDAFYSSERKWTTKIRRELIRWEPTPPCKL